MTDVGHNRHEQNPLPLMAQAFLITWRYSTTRMDVERKGKDPQAQQHSNETVLPKLTWSFRATRRHKLLQTKTDRYITSLGERNL